ncbi:MAG: hypothetical protein JKY65_07235 [Planctomycetes bacterium]|nr:hypothetical protein [Planctomycetota bacterium]
MIRSLEEAVRLDPKLAHVHADLGHCRAMAGDPKAGLPDCERAVALEPKVASHYGKRGIVLAGAGELEAGLKDLTRGLQLQAADPELHT